MSGVEFPVPDRDHAAANLVDSFRGSRRSHPEQIAVTTGVRSLTYRELDVWSRNVSALLRDAGVGPGARVALRLPPDLEMIVAILGILRRGAAYVPLDVRNPPARNRYIVTDCGATTLVGENDGDLPVAGVLSADEVSRARSRDADEGDEQIVSAETVAYIIYTSGTTGHPKGVAIRHGNVMALLAGAGSVFDFRSTDRWLLFHSVSFDFSVWESWGALHSGGTLVVLPHWVARSPRSCLRVLAEQRITVLNQTPTAFAGLAAAAITAAADLPALRYVILGGEKVAPSALRPWATRYGLDRPWVVNGYGITETTVFTSFHRIIDGELDSDEANIGRPLPGHSIRIVGDGGRDVGVGEVGELWLAGPQVATGYLHRPELTATCFPKAPGPAGRLIRYYRSGDLVRRTANGELVYDRRADLQLKVRGYRIEPSEVESAVRRHPAVADAVVVLREVTRRDLRLVCAYRTTGAATVDESQLREHVAELLPSYLWPAHYVRLDELPRTMNGKVDRVAALRIVEKRSASCEEGNGN